MTASVRVDTARASEPVIRLATDADVPALVDMDRHGREAILGQRGGLAWNAEHPPLESLVGATGSSIYVADLLGHPVGYLVCSYRDETTRGRLCVIDRVYVDERCRDIGCGDALLAHAIDTARRQGCAFIEGEALPGDRETKNLFERAGVTARRIIVSKGL